MSTRPRRETGIVLPRMGPFSPPVNLHPGLRTPRWDQCRFKSLAPRWFCGILKPSTLVQIDRLTLDAPL